MKFGTLVMAVAIGAVIALSIPAIAEEPLSPGSAGPYSSDNWVRVGIDENNDGTIDRWDWVLASDLERARTAGMQRQSPTGYYNRGYQPETMGTTTRHEEMVAGPVRDLRPMNLAGFNEDHLVGKVTASDGRIARVDFGPVGVVNQLNLHNGEKITVYGLPGTINDRPMLMAHRIEAGGQTLMVQLPADRDMAPYAGRILSVRTATFEGRNMPEQVFARVSLDGGGTTAVNLGPRNQLRDVDLKNLEGKRVSFLAHPAIIGGQRALVADELRLDGRMITIDWSA